MELSEQPLAVNNVVQLTKHFISGQPDFGHNCFWGVGVAVWDCFSFECKLDLYVFDGNLTGQRYRDNVLAPRVVPHFDNPASCCKQCCTIRALCGLALSSMNIGLPANA
jgi:hypothetical protein